MAATISRKLFHVTTGTYQQPTNCSACPYDCPFDCYGVPDFFFSPPPPPSPADHQNHLQPLVIVLIALFVGFFIAFTFYTIVVKCRYRGSGTGNRGAEPPQSDGGEGEFLNGNQIDHPIWYITTAGLQQSVINSITVCKYEKNEGLIDGTDCSVCLSEFQEGEMLRLLPKCSHAFHIGCVDTWLRTHTTCPLCRAHILTDFATSNSIRPSNLGPVNQNEADLIATEETHIQNREINGEVLRENLGVVSGAENRGGSVDEQRDIGIQVGEIVPKDGEIEGNEIVRMNNQMDSSS